MVYLAFLGGVILGAIGTQIIMHLDSICGFFEITPDPEEEAASYVRVIIPQNKPLDKKKKIILTKRNSQK